MITSKGQVTLRKSILSHLGVRPGQRVRVEMLPNGRVEIVAARSGGKISDVFGCLKGERPRSLSIGEINEIINQGWAARR